MRRQVFFDACDQVWNADGLGEEWMALDPQARSCLSLRHKSCQKDNRCSMQCRIGLNPCSDFAAIRSRHRNIKQDKVGFKTLCCLMGLGRIVLFADEVATRPLQRELG